MDAALKEAQEAGYAEADPSYDIEGIDTACKLVIIANWIMGLKASIRDVRITGIKNVTLRDIEQAEKEGCCVKLIGSIEKGLLVQPQLIPKNHPLCVSGTLNAVTFDIEFLGEITIAGRGAGGMETANAILRDLIDVRRTLLK
jgi:homoserine dehydrogenase